VKGVEIEEPVRAWDCVGRLARQFDTPGCRIAVNDERGGIAILVGARTANAMLDGHASGRGSYV